jgi:hypothetical protein
MVVGFATTYAISAFKQHVFIIEVWFNHDLDLNVVWANNKYKIYASGTEETLFQNTQINCQRQEKKISALQAEPT